jgi:hypothetical protein
MQGLTNEEEDMFSIGIITLLEENISLLSVGVSEIISTKESNSK